MEQARAEELRAVQKLAYDALRSKRYLESDPSKGCQLLIMPSFENVICWDVLDVGPTHESGGIRLHRTCWRMDFDFEALNDPIKRLRHPRPYHPTLETAWTELDRTALTAILAGFSAIRIPLHVTNPDWGCDGTTYELAIGDYFWNTRIRWWNHLPDEWQELQAPLDELEKLFESAWEQKS